MSGASTPGLLVGQSCMQAMLGPNVAYSFLTLTRPGLAQTTPDTARPDPTQRWVRVRLGVRGWGELFSNSPDFFVPISQFWGDWEGGSRPDSLGQPKLNSWTREWGSRGRPRLGGTQLGRDWDPGWDSVRSKWLRRSNFGPGLVVLINRVYIGSGRGLSVAPNWPIRRPFKSKPGSDGYCLAGAL